MRLHYLAPLSAGSLFAAILLRSSAARLIFGRYRSRSSSAVSSSDSSSIRTFDSISSAIRFRSVSSMILFMFFQKCGRAALQQRGRSRRCPVSAVVTEMNSRDKRERRFISKDAPVRIVTILCSPVHVLFDHL